MPSHIELVGDRVGVFVLCWTLRLMGLGICFGGLIGLECAVWTYGWYVMAGSGLLCRPLAFGVGLLVDSRRVWWDLDGVGENYYDLLRFGWMLNALKFRETASHSALEMPKGSGVSSQTEE